MKPILAPRSEKIPGTASMLSERPAPFLPFIPPGDPLAKLRAHLSFGDTCLAIEQRLNEEEERNVKWREVEARQIILQFFGEGRAKHRAATRRVRELIPDAKERKRLRKEVCAELLAAIENPNKPTPRQSQREEKQREKLRRRIEFRNGIRKAAKQVLDGLNELARAVREHDSKDAAKELAEAANLAALLSEVASENHPDAVIPLARVMKTWAVTASTDAKEWIPRTKANLKKLQLGKDWPDSCTIRDTDAAPRKWAEEILITIYINRQCRKYVLADRNIPRWAMSCTALPLPFNLQHFPEWWTVSEAMLKDQCPDLVDHPDWKNVKGHAVSAGPFGRLRKGTIQCRILAIIRTALRRRAVLASD